jgi:tyrosine-protein phosphatase YwqE
MLKWLRKKNSSPRCVAVTLRVRDCHTHVIPGVDDGSRSTSESLEMLQLLIDTGVQTVVATPHIYPGRFDNEPEELSRAFERLEYARATAKLPVTLELGAEHYLCEPLIERIRKDRVIAFGPERYVLFETSTGEHVPPILMDAVYRLLERGYRPLMAHVERYRYLRSEEGWELCEDLRSAGVRFQVNRTRGPIDRRVDNPRGRFIARLLDRGWVDEVGSDMHRPTADGRPYLAA